MKIIKGAKIKIEDKWIDIKIPLSFLDKVAKRKDWSILDKVKGMWKEKKEDALKFQKRLRKEWK